MDTDAIAALPDGKTLTVESGLRLLRRGSALIWQTKFRAGGKAFTRALGPYPDLSLETARAAAAEARGKAQPASVPKVSPTVKPAGPGAPTFGAVAAEWLPRPLNGPKSPATLEAHKRQVALMRPLHGLPVDKITWEDCRSALQHIQTTNGVMTAHRVKFAMRTIFTFSRENYVRTLVNPCSESDSWLDAFKVEHHAAIVEPGAFGQLAEQVDTWEPRGGNVANALKLLMRVVTRQGELRGATWGEFRDLDKPEAARWEIPSARMKMKEPHIVPLAPAAVGIIEMQREALRGATGPTDWVFPGAKNAAKGRSMQSQALTDALNALGFEGKHTPHGFRTSFSTLAREAGKEDSLIEMCLAHKDANAVRAAYDRSRRLDARRELMNWWADEIERLQTPEK